MNSLHMALMAVRTLRRGAARAAARQREKRLLKSAFFFAVFINLLEVKYNKNSIITT
jgi:hypothetical protein